MSDLAGQRTGQQTRQYGGAGLLVNKRGERVNKLVNQHVAGDTLRVSDSNIARYIISDDEIFLRPEKLSPKVMSETLRAGLRAR